jgi:hypothetical protein
MKVDYSSCNIKRIHISSVVLLITLHCISINDLHRSILGALGLGLSFVNSSSALVISDDSSEWPPSSSSSSELEISFVNSSSAFAA